MDNIFWQIGPITIYWYSLLILIAVIIGINIITKEASRNNISISYINDLLFYVVIVGIVGARIYYVIFNFALFKDNLLSIFKIWEGGLAIYGAILSGIVFIFYFSKKKNESFIKTLDIMAPALILGQAIGRWGNFFNQEAYGVRTTYHHLKELYIPEFIINNMYINGAYYTPTFLYESILCLFGFIILMLFRKKNRTKLGMQIALYFIIYGTGRLFIEGLRMDSLYLGSIRVSQLVSLILIIIGIIILFSNFIKKNKNN